MPQRLVRHFTKPFECGNSARYKGLGGWNRAGYPAGWYCWLDQQFAATVQPCQVRGADVPEPKIVLPPT